MYRPSARNRISGCGRGGYGSGVRGGRGYAPANADSTYRAPTPGLETALFDCDGSKSAAIFEETRKKWMYVGTQAYAGANAASCAIETMKAPVFEEPVKPTKEKFPEQEIYDGEIKLYFDARLEISKKRSAWQEVGPRNFTLLLLHCPPRVKSRLSGRPGWNKVNKDRDLIGLLRLLREVARSQDETKSKVMTVVEKT